MKNRINSVGGTVQYKATKKINAQIDLLNQDDGFNQTNRSLINTKVNYRFSNQNRAEIRLGYSNEVHEGVNGTFKTPGFLVLWLGIRVE